MQQEINNNNNNDFIKQEKRAILSKLFAEALENIYRKFKTDTEFASRYNMSYVIYARHVVYKRMMSLTKEEISIHTAKEIEMFIIECMDRCQKVTELNLKKEIKKIENLEKGRKK